MKIIAALSLFLLTLGTVGVAAAPAKAETAARVSYTDRKAQAPAPAEDWVELASPTPCSHAREFITVDGAYAQLRLTRANGRPAIRHVRVVFADGAKDKVVAVTRLPKTIDVGGHPIDHVVVSTDSRAKGSYTLHGAPATGGVASR